MRRFWIMVPATFLTGAAGFTKGYWQSAMLEVGCAMLLTIPLYFYEKRLETSLEKKATKAVANAMESQKNNLV